MNYPSSSRFSSSSFVPAAASSRPLRPSLPSLPSQSPGQLLDKVIRNMSSPDVQEMLAFSWVSAIHATSESAPFPISAAEAAHLLSPFWRLGKTQGLEGRELFEFATRHVLAELPAYGGRRKLALEAEFPTSPSVYNQSPQPFMENRLYEPLRVGGVGYPGSRYRRSPYRRSPRNFRPEGVPPQTRYPIQY